MKEDKPSDHISTWNGAVTAAHRWSQTLEEVTIELPLPELYKCALEIGDEMNEEAEKVKKEKEEAAAAEKAKAEGKEGEVAAVAVAAVEKTEYAKKKEAELIKKVNVKELKVDIKKSYVKVTYKGTKIFEGDLTADILGEESVWNLEDGTKLILSLAK